MALRLVGMVAAFSLGASGVALAQSAPPRSLGALERGSWELTAAQDGVPTTRLCLGDVRQLLQPRHTAAQCRHFVSEEDAEHIIVAYDCGAQGQGRTALRIETGRLVQIDTQGIAAGSPFSLHYEGRRVGNCRVADSR